MAPPQKPSPGREFAPLAALLEREPDVVGAYLFGSRSRGEARPDSDLDLAVLFDPPATLDRLVDLENRLGKGLALRVQLTDLARAKAFLALAAIEGERVFERDGRRLDEFDLYVLRRAGDLAYFERQRRSELLTPGQS
jgi:predicted nucleotidyltransferase